MVPNPGQVVQGEDVSKDMFISFAVGTPRTEEALVWAPLVKPIGRHSRLQDVLVGLIPCVGREIVDDLHPR